MKTLLSLLILCSAAFGETNEGSHKLLQQIQKSNAPQHRAGVRIEVLHSSKEVLEAVEANRRAGTYFQMLVWSSKDPNSKVFKRFFEEAANSNQNREIHFYSYNLDAEEDSAKTLGIPSVPSVLMESPFKVGELRKWSPLVSEQYASGQTVQQRVRLVTREEYGKVLEVQRDLQEKRVKNSK